MRVIPAGSAVAPGRIMGVFMTGKTDGRVPLNPIPNDGRQTVDGSFLSTVRNSRGFLPVQKA